MNLTKNEPEPHFLSLVSANLRVVCVIKHGQDRLIGVVLVNLHMIPFRRGDNGKRNLFACFNPSLREGSCPRVFAKKGSDVRMRAIPFDRYGEPAQVLMLREVPRPEPLEEEVRVRILASPINPSEILYLSLRVPLLVTEN